MEELPIEYALKAIAMRVALGLEFVVVLVILFGAVLAIGKLSSRGGRTFGPLGSAGVYIGLGRWLVIGLEFALAADIVRTAVSPTWDEIGRLAAIAVIRTFLNYFLTKDIEEYTARTKEQSASG